MELLILDFEIMDKKHMEFLELVNSFNPNDFNDFIPTFKQHIEEHFQQENELMEKYGFFAYHCHKAEHDKVLDEFYSLIEKHNKDEIINYFHNIVPNWFEQHLNTMDFVTANYLKNAI